MNIVFIIGDEGININSSLTVKLTFNYIKKSSCADNPIKIFIHIFIIFIHLAMNYPLNVHLTDCG